MSGRGTQCKFRASFLLLRCASLIAVNRAAWVSSMIDWTSVILSNDSSIPCTEESTVIKCTAYSIAIASIVIDNIFHTVRVVLFDDVICCPGYGFLVLADEVSPGLHNTPVSMRVFQGGGRSCGEKMASKMVGGRLNEGRNPDFQSS